MNNDWMEDTLSTVKHTDPIMPPDELRQRLMALAVSEAARHTVRSRWTMVCLAIGATGLAGALGVVVWWLTQLSRASASSSSLLTIGAWWLRFEADVTVFVTRVSFNGALLSAWFALGLAVAVLCVRWDWRSRT